MLINKLIEASQAGVYIDMVVRGICCLRAGVPDETENIHIISIVGRYLEHSRIYIFGQGERARYYIGSADWMPRNLDNRIEVITPVYDPMVKAEMRLIVDYGLRDSVQGRLVDGSGQNRQWTCRQDHRKHCTDTTPNWKKKKAETNKH